ncbi:dihydrodipicolinate synthase family protein [Sulfitobacter mediterraneus]|uniref:dihydrodipicolinate synthase family protein n=1 Tax=Sulfitobacter mediterraneus TaxID=83219 RepID=UPI0021A6FFBC|nr:dihydrodipicolinate synthase family protein [Sulfitobacter mediterraneus]UWR13437.1 dihydrodipicolinate synthase family protein [Sulfitobacter mediterraneus]
MTTSLIGGVLPVLYAFFDNSGQLRQEGFRHQVDHCLAAGAGGVVLFGFVTQFYRLSFAEKVESLRTTVAAVNAQGSVCVTVMEPSPDGQAELIRVAREEGADWVILQPPLGPPAMPSDWIEMLGELIADAGLPVAVQNANMATTQLSNTQLVKLQEQCPNLVGVKAETSAEDVAAFCQSHANRFRILVGDWGVEYPFFARQGAHGLIPASNFVSQQVAQYQAAQGGNWSMVDDIQQKILPLMQFFRERVAPEGQVLLGKMAYGWATGLEPGGNRRPGPNRLDPAILHYAQHLWQRLQTG